MYSPKSLAYEGGKGVGIASLALRSATILFSLIGFAVMSSSRTALDVKSYVFLLSMDVIVCVYAIVQRVLSIIFLVSGRTVLSSETAAVSIITHVLYQVLAYALMSACGAATTISVVLGSCNKYYYSTEVFCIKGAGSVAMSFIAFVCLALSTALGYFRLLKLAK